jgi:hypothetical protein
MDASAIGNIANTLAHLMLHRNINAGRDHGLATLTQSKHAQRQHLLTV